MKYVTMDELRQQMRVDFDDEDALIETYGEAAERHVIESTRRTEEELLLRGWKEQHAGEAPETVPVECFPKRLKVAVLILAAHMYRNREMVAAVAQNCVPYTYEILMKPYVRLA
jgi:hypothetical protein